MRGRVSSNFAFLFPPQIRGRKSLARQAFATPDLGGKLRLHQVFANYRSSDIIPQTTHLSKLALVSPSGPEKGSAASV